ncbi:hypothetical protein EDC96DRAFT_552294 [Choanephora cucurbitarum]|nr:hypothetical protein EDC96DRAFT_552294 [Choanephora cucurbitarum]
METIQTPPVNYQDYIPTDSIQCPICGISTSSLQGLNRHLDTQHSEEDSKGALLSWLKNAQKKVQTSFKSSPPTDKFKQWIDQPVLNSLQLANTNAFFVSDTDKQSDLVTRDHWQRETNHDPCRITGCHRIVGKAGAGKQHCRSSSTISLERSDSTSSRDSLGSMLSAKSSFVSNSNSILSMKLKYRDGEQSVIKWEDDRLAKTCPLCQRKLKQEEASKPLPIIQLYHQLAITRNNIEKLLPTFHQTILMLEKEKIKTQTHESFKKAAKIRKSLLDNFTLYDTLAKSIKSLPARSACMKRLQANICNAAQMYLQQNMLPLQMLPRILKTNQPVKQHNELEAQLQTYLEQYSLVEGFIQEANMDRKYDDVKTLKSSLEELDQEIRRLKKALVIS